MKSPSLINAVVPQSKIVDYLLFTDALKLWHVTDVVPQSKIVDYLLSGSHASGRGKAQFSNNSVFRPTQWEVLAQALR